MLRDRCKLKKRKARGGAPWPFSRGCQTYWEACQKCGAPNECYEEELSGEIAYWVGSIHAHDAMKAVSKITK